MSSLSTNKVLIVGAGIAGLVLAQVLRKHNIEYEIFERDHDYRSRKQGWAIALVECLPDLYELLPGDLGDLLSTSVNANIKESDYLAIVHTDTTTSYLGRLGASTPESPGFFLRAGREHFRNYLWNHVPVSTGKQFSHYVEDQNSVTVFFHDGTSATGSILIGADGASSHVRTQLLGDMGSKVEISPYIPLVGECTLTRAQFEPYARYANAGIVGGSPGLRIAICRRSISADGETGEYFYALSPRSENPKRDSDWTRHATKEELYQKCLEVCKLLPDNLADIVSIAGVDGVVAPPIRLLEFVPPSTMPKGRVTLLGDAAHSMTPFRGAGANTAIEDACDMARLLIRRQHDGAPDTWQGLIEEYNAMMVPRGQRMVHSSHEAGEERISTSALEGRVHHAVPEFAEVSGGKNVVVANA